MYSLGISSALLLTFASVTLANPLLVKRSAGGAGAPGGDFLLLPDCSAPPQAGQPGTVPDQSCQPLPAGASVQRAPGPCDQVLVFDGPNCQGKGQILAPGQCLAGQVSIKAVCIPPGPPAPTATGPPPPMTSEAGPQMPMDAMAGPGGMPPAGH